MGASLVGIRKQLSRVDLIGRRQAHPCMHLNEFRRPFALRFRELGGLGGLNTIVLLKANSFPNKEREDKLPLEKEFTLGRQVWEYSADVS
jgi:hypothetical protein